MVPPGSQRRDGSALPAYISSGALTPTRSSARASTCRVASTARGETTSAPGESGVEHRAVAVEGVEVGGEVAGVGHEPVRRPQLDGRAADVREVGERAYERSLARLRRFGLGRLGRGGQRRPRAAGSSRCARGRTARSRRGSPGPAPRPGRDRCRSGRRASAARDRGARRPRRSRPSARRAARRRRGAWTCASARRPRSGAPSGTARSRCATGRSRAPAQPPSAAPSSRGDRRPRT